MNHEELDTRDELNEFFDHLHMLGLLYQKYTGEAPKHLMINPEIIAQMSRIDGFYQREELGTEVSAHAPIVRYLKLSVGIVTIVEDWEEKFLHFD